MKTNNWMILTAIGGILLVCPAKADLASTGYVDRNLASKSEKASPGDAGQIAVVTASGEFTGGGISATDINDSLISTQAAATAAQATAEAAQDAADAAQTTADAAQTAAGNAQTAAAAAQTTANSAQADATAAQGTANTAKTTADANAAALLLKANTADLATVATTGAYSDLLGKPTLGTAASANTSDFATAAQGALATSAVQPGAISDMETKTNAAATFAVKGTETVAANAASAASAAQDAADAAQTTADAAQTAAGNAQTAAQAAQTTANAAQTAASTAQTAAEAAQATADTKQDKVAAGTAGTVLTQSGTAGTFGTRAVDTTPTSASSNLVTSGGVYDYAIPKPSEACLNAADGCALVTRNGSLVWEIVAR